MLGWDRQQGNLDWHGRLHDKAFEGREMATTPGAGRTVAMKIIKLILDLCYYIACIVVTVLVWFILISLFA